MDETPEPPEPRASTPGRRDRAGSDDDAEPNHDLRLALAAVVLLVLAMAAWVSRDFVASLLAGSYTATIELTTPTDTDDARLARAFAVARGEVAGDATLEPSAGPTHFRDVHVRGPRQTEALARAQAFSHAIVAAFDAAGSGHLDAVMYPTAYPVPGPASRLLWSIMVLGATALALAAIAVCWSYWRRQKSRPGHIPAEIFWTAVVLFFGIPAAFVVLPGWVFMALLAMAIPCAIAWKIVSRVREAERAAEWPSAQGRIVRSQTRAVHHKGPDGATTVDDAPDIEYAYSVDGVEYRGHRIGIADIAPGSADVEPLLDSYRVGWSGPVFYNPARPGEALLERNPPASPTVMVLVAAGAVLIGFAIVLTFSQIGEIIHRLQPHFPPGAVVQGVLFCLLGGSMTALFLLSDHLKAWAAVRWPQVQGEIISSVAESRRMLVPRGGNKTIEVWSPVVEYTYRVDGRYHHGARIAFGALVKGARALAEATTARYPKGRAVTVHYNPANPAFAVLETRVAFAWLTFLVTVAFFAGAVFFAGLL